MFLISFSEVPMFEEAIRCISFTNNKLALNGKCYLSDVFEVIYTTNCIKHYISNNFSMSIIESERIISDMISIIKCF